MRSKQSYHPKPFLTLITFRCCKDSAHLCVRLKQKQDLDCETNPSLESVDESVDDFSIIPLGKSLSRVIPLPSDTGHTYLLLEDLITTYISRFFPGREVLV